MLIRNSYFSCTIDRWLIPAVIVLIVLAVVFPVLIFVYGAPLAVVGLAAATTLWG
jgi:hypothetical protein